MFVLFFFAQADGIVMENLSSNFQQEVDIKEAKAFYAMQNAIEAIHNETYATMIETLIRDEELKEKAFDAIRYCPEIRKMAAWVFYWMDRKHSLQIRMFAFACFEGIFFSSAFCAVRWVGGKNKLPGFTQSNELISRDEKLHLEFAICLLNKMKFDVPDDIVKLMVDTSFEILSDFIRNSLKIDLIGMSAYGMIEYTKCCYNYLTKSLSRGEYFPSPDPYIWMSEMGMANKTNFFEKKVTEYAKVTNTAYNFVEIEDF